jgi:glutamate-ammonia-ligase adenylyltransferase
VIAAYSSIAFSDPARAEANLAQVDERLPPALRAALPLLLAQTPAPDDALNFLERFLRPETGAPPRIIKFLEERPAALHYLLTVFSYSRFLSETLIQQPGLISTLLRPPRAGESESQSARGIERSRSLENLREEYARFETASFDTPPAVALARFKRREYLRIMLRDVLGFATLADTTLELSQLADMLLDRALRFSAQKLADAWGTPQRVSPEGRRQSCDLVILSLGKLGGQELNYNSDIDLMFLYAAEGETSGGASGTTSNHEYFVRLAQAVLQLITESTPEGAIFRVDLRLRPQGAEGELAVSLSTALDYYRFRAREWELQMLIRARCSAGDLETARHFLREVKPLVYRPDFRLEVVEAVLEARGEITRSLERRETRRGGQARRLGTAGSASSAAHASHLASGVPPSLERPAGWNVKLSPGGIRDIEFLSQSLQRLYGGEDAWLQVPATLLALQRLHDKGHLSGRDFHRLAAAYQFLRIVEHRLQLRDGLQRHTLPDPPDSLDRLARRCGLEAADGRPAREALLQSIASHFENVREIYNRLLSRRRTEPPRKDDAPAADAAGPAFVGRIAEDFPGVAAELERLTAELDTASYLRRGLFRFLSSASLSPVMACLEEHPEWLRAAAALFDRSDLAVDLLSRNPGEVSLAASADFPVPPGVVDPESMAEPMLPFIRTTAQRAGDLRAAYGTALFREIAFDLMDVGASPVPAPFPSFARLTALAEDALRVALRIAVEEVFGDRQPRLDQAPFTVLALGRLGSREMSVGSDADLIFVADAGLDSTKRESWRRAAERFVHVVSSHTREGQLFPLDTRLRPRGHEGELLPARDALRDYLSGEAAAWEAITFLKLRPVAGNLTLGTAVVEDANAVLSRRFGDPARRREFACELIRIREKVEQDAAGPRAKGRFKKVAGGFYDLEYILGYLTFTRSIAPSDGNTLAQLHSLEAAGTLDAAGIETLRTTAVLYRGADHAARLITGRPLSSWPEPALAERISRLLRQWGVVWEGDLRAALESRARALRALYLATISR